LLAWLTRFSIVAVESRFDRNEGWHEHPELEEATENFGVKDVVWDGKTAVSAGGCGMLTLKRSVSLHTL